MILKKKMDPRGSCAPTAAINMYISIIFKPLLLLNRLANQSQILCEASIEWGINVYINNLGHMTKMAAMPIYGKNHQKSSSLKPIDSFQGNLA